MTLTIHPENTIAVEQLQNFFREGHERAQHLNRPVVASLCAPVEAFDPIQIFDCARQWVSARYFWSQPREGFTIVGLGAAQTIEISECAGIPSRFEQAAEAWAQVMAEAHIEAPFNLPGVGPVFLGGFAFDAGTPATQLWQGYPHGRLVLPRLIYTQRDDETWLTYNAVLDPHDDPDAEAEALNVLHDRLTQDLGRGRRLYHSGAFPSTTVRELRPGSAWQADVARAAQAVRDGELEKVVLARAVQLQTSKPFNVTRALRQLSTNYTGCYIFAFAQDERCFLGATPERLVRLHDGEVLTMSLAGSSRRGETRDEDKQLGQALLTSAKDRREHALVVQSVIEALTDSCLTLQWGDEPTLLKLGNIQHLYTPIVGQLADGYTIFDLVEQLHPTPAVGGRPREAGLAFIRECEELDRGWYAGPVGWLNDQGEGEFAVALRSALIRDNIATLFAGCGIVGDSDPEREYAESMLKLRPMLNALTGFSGQ
jgi:isochorismate synthase